YLDNTANEVVIKNYANLDIKKLGLYNILGQAIKTWNNLGAELEHRLRVRVPGTVYIVAITTEQGIVRKKVNIN
ncbi:MAG: T9SS type A sorting domain-containing protein, partial [Flavobacteriaceae bacterium]|nr:T9SS type A sorting domain-containing protein [Flavobacteriaceae bacterium]